MNAFISEGDIPSFLTKSYFTQAIHDHFSHHVGSIPPKLGYQLVAYSSIINPLFLFNISFTDDTRWQQLFQSIKQIQAPLERDAVLDFLQHLKEYMISIILNSRPFTPFQPIEDTENLLPPPDNEQENDLEQDIE